MTRNECRPVPVNGAGHVVRRGPAGARVLGGPKVATGKTCSANSRAAADRAGPAAIGVEAPAVNSDRRDTRTAGSASTRYFARAPESVLPVLHDAQPGGIETLNKKHQKKAHSQREGGGLPKRRRNAGQVQVEDLTLTAMLWSRRKRNMHRSITSMSGVG